MNASAPRPPRAGVIPLAIAALVIMCGVICGGNGGTRPARGEERAAGATAAPATCPRAAFRVVVDVGHTLDVPGAISARGVPEYAFNLRLAGEIRDKLVAAGFAKTVLLITAEAPPLGLVQRTLRAKALGADLFISIHHDSVPENLLENWDYEGQPNHFSDRFKGFALFISNDNADRAGSLKFGQLLGRALAARGLSYTPHYTLALMANRRRELLDAVAGVYRYDQLIVLRDTRMPAVLLEAGSIVNRDEELELGTVERRSLISAAVTAAVADFCAARARALAKRPPAADAAAQRRRARPTLLAR
jgi:N-acetylmuramoyl-L-alanine amidase